MTFIKTLVIVCLVGSSLAAPRPVDWDALGRKIKDFGNQVKDKVNEVKEKVLPAARSACEFVNTLPQDLPSQGFQPQGFQPQGYFPSSGRGFPEAPGFPHYFSQNSFYPSRFPSYNPSTQGFNPGFFPSRPSVGAPTTTERFTPNSNFNPPGFNPFNNGFNTARPEFASPSSTEGIAIPNPDLIHSNGGLDPVSVITQAPQSNSGVNSPNSGSNSGLNPVDFGSSGFNPSSSGYNPSGAGNDPSISGGFDLSNAGSVTSSPKPHFTVEQDDMNKNDIPPFIPPRDEDGIENGYGDINYNGLDEQLDNSGNVLPEFRDLGHRYGY